MTLRRSFLIALLLAACAPAAAPIRWVRIPIDGARDRVWGLPINYET